MNKPLGAAALAAALLSTLLLAVQAQAISRGTPDGNAHPMVAALGITTPDGVLQGCGATLVSETVMVTAAHCVAPGALPPGSQLRVNFATNPTPDDAGWFAPAGAVADPEFGHGNGHSSDVGVVLLGPGQSGGRPVAQLPALDQLGHMAADKTLAGTRFDLVGYGCDADGSSGGPHRITCGPPERRSATAPFQALRPSWLVLDINVNATGEGGQCFRDSGGPQFIHDTLRIVSVTSHGDTWCRATNANARLDTAAARAFLAGFVELP